MSTYNTFKTNPQSEIEGFVADLGEPGKFTICRAGGANANYYKALQRLSQPHRQAIRNEMIDPEVQARIIREAFAEAVVIGWEGVTDENEQPLPYSKENAIKLFNDLPDLFAQIQGWATNMANFRFQRLKADAKN